MMPFLVAAVISWAVTWWVVKRGKYLGIIDDPKKHKHPKVVHEHPVPRGGGIPIFVALLSVLAFLGVSKQILGVVLGAAILAVVGFLDDKFEEKISPYLRLGINVLAALVVIGAGIGIAYVTNPLGGVIDLSWPRWCLGTHCIWILSDIFALAWLGAEQKNRGR